MTVLIKYVSGALLIGFLFASHVPAADNLASVLTRMDAGAPKFKAMTAHVKMLSYTAIIDDTTVDEGTIIMRRNQRGGTDALLDFEGDRDPRTIAFQDKTIDIYYPKAKLVQSYDLGKKIKLVDQYLLLGFGTSGEALAAGYEISFAGTETVNGQSASKLQLIPKSKDVLQNLKKVDIWIPVGGDHPIQQKFYRPSNDYSLITYTNYKQNPPLSANALQLKTPPGVKKERP